MCYQVALEILAFAPKSGSNAFCSSDVDSSINNTNESCKVSSSSSRSCAQSTSNKHSSSGTTDEKLGLEGLRGMAKFTVDNGCLNQWEMLDWYRRSDRPSEFSPPVATQHMHVLFFQCLTTDTLLLVPITTAMNFISSKSPDRCAKALTQGETGDFLVKVPNSASIQESAIHNNNDSKQATAVGNTDTTNDGTELISQALPSFDAFILNGVLTQAERFEPSSSEAMSQDKRSAVQAAQTALLESSELVASSSEDSKESQEFIFVRATLVMLDKHCGRKPVSYGLLVNIFSI